METDPETIIRLFPVNYLLKKVEKWGCLPDRCQKKETFRRIVGLEKLKLERF